MDAPWENDPIEQHDQDAPWMQDPVADDPGGMAVGQGLQKIFDQGVNADELIKAERDYPGVVDYVKDALVQVPSGVNSGLSLALQFPANVVDSVASALGADPNFSARYLSTEQFGINDPVAAAVDTLEQPHMQPKAETALGETVHTMSEIAGGSLPFMGPAVKLAQAAAKAPKPVFKAVDGRVTSTTPGVARQMADDIAADPTRAIATDTAAAASAGIGVNAARDAELGPAGEMIAGVVTGMTPGGVIGATQATRHAAGRAKDAASGQVAARGPQMLSSRDAGEIADDVIAQRLQNSDIRPEDLVRDVDQGLWARDFGPNSKAELPEMLADQSDSMQRLAGSVYRTGDEAGQIIKGRLDNRQRGVENPYAKRVDETPRGQLERLTDGLERALKIKTSKSAYRTERQLIDEQKAKGDIEYKKARDQSEPFDIDGPLQALKLESMQMDDASRASVMKAINLFTRPKVNAIRKQEDRLIAQMAKAAEKASGEGPGAQKAARLHDNLAKSLEGVRSRRATLEAERLPVTDIRRFDYAKQALDDMIGKAKRDGGNNIARLLTRLKHDLLKRVHTHPESGVKINQAYEKARNEWSSTAESVDALNLGRKALRENSEVSVDQFRDLTPFQQKMFRIGLLESMRQLRRNSPRGGNAAGIFERPHIVEILKEAIPPQSAGKKYNNLAERFGDYTRREARMSQTRQVSTGGSPTGRNVSDDALFNSEVAEQQAADALGKAVQMGRNATNLLLDYSIGLLAKQFSYRRDVAREMAKRLTETDPARRIEYIQSLREKMKPRERMRVLKAMEKLSEAVVASTGTGVGIAEGE